MSSHAEEFFDDVEPAAQNHTAAQNHIAAPNHKVPDVEELLIQAIEALETARPAPLSTAVKIEAEPLLDLLYDARERLPEELRAARWLLRDREEHLESQRIEGEEIIAAARSKAQRLVERTEVSRAAEQSAQRIIAQAKAEATHMRRQTEDFCDARLASLEGILQRTSSVVATGRARMQGTADIDLDVGHEREIDLTNDDSTLYDDADFDGAHYEEADYVAQPPPPGPRVFDQDLT